MTIVASAGSCVGRRTFPQELQYGGESPQASVWLYHSLRSSTFLLIFQAPMVVWYCRHRWGQALGLHVHDRTKEKRGVSVTRNQW